MAKGKIGFFNDTGGYGFVSTDDADDDVLLHMEGVGGPDLEEDQEVEFDIGQVPKGPRATSVTRLQVDFHSPQYIHRLMSFPPFLATASGGVRWRVVGWASDTHTCGKVVRPQGRCTVAMAKGKVDSFNDAGGYGFISTDDVDDDVFSHMGDVGGLDLKEGQEVEFDIEQTPKDPYATNVTHL